MGCFDQPPQALGSRRHGQRGDFGRRQGSLKDHQADHPGADETMAV